MKIMIGLSLMGPSLGGFIRCMSSRNLQPFHIQGSSFDNSVSGDLLLSRNGTENWDDNVHPILSQDQINLVSTLVNTRAMARWNGNFHEADKIRSQLNSLDFLPSDVSILLQDKSRKDGGGSTWTLTHQPKHHELELSCSGPSVLQLAHAALGLAISSSEMGSVVCTDKLRTLLNEANNRLQMSPIIARQELNGRKAADAAFWFALAGASNEKLLNTLADIAAEELQRFGCRASCRTKDVWQILERFAAAGLKHHNNLENAAVAALTAKEEDASKLKRPLDFFADRCLMMIWKFSTRQRKQRIFLEMARNHWIRSQTPSQGTTVLLRDSCHTIDWHQIFQDPSKPLVIDIGCGMGVSLLGLAYQQCNGETKEGIDFPWVDCNFAGVDLSGVAITYAQSLAELWDLNVHFFYDSAESFIQKVLETYPGSVQMCMVQFPTPYRLPTVTNVEFRGNKQLPESATNGFMVSENLLHLVNKVLDPGGMLLVQSNCEDVAVWIRTVALNCCRFESVNLIPSTAATGGITNTELSKRSLNWIALGGERAQGAGWSVSPLLPQKGRSETEVACMINGTPVHRCILIKHGSSRTKLLALQTGG